jgi:hypothetical protein
VESETYTLEPGEVVTQLTAHYSRNKLAGFADRREQRDSVIEGGTSVMCNFFFFGFILAFVRIGPYLWPGDRWLSRKYCFCFVKIMRNIFI